jgi:hypothetical protein
LSTIDPAIRPVVWARSGEPTNSRKAAATHAFVRCLIDVDASSKNRKAEKRTGGMGEVTDVKSPPDEPDSRGVAQELLFNRLVRMPVQNSSRGATPIEAYG